MFKPEIKHKQIIINNLLRIKNIKKWKSSINAKNYSKRADKICQPRGKY